MKKHIPNILSVLRIIGAIALFVMPVFELQFFIVYALCALFDFADGFLAKSLDAKTETGYRLDHIASILFIVLMSVRYTIVMLVPDAIILVAVGIAIIKCASIVFGAVRFKKAPFINTDWNKWAKCGFYLAPAWYLFAGMIFAGCVVLFLLFVASVEELIINLTCKQFNPDTRTIINFKKIFKKTEKKSK